VNSATINGVISSFRAFPKRSAASASAEGEWAAGCVARVRRGDREAFGELYRRYSRLVHGVLLARLPASPKSPTWSRRSSCSPCASSPSSPTAPPSRPGW
jgi:hypothetical protein